MQIDKAERLVNPPIILSPEAKRLCPPIDPDAYMRYLAENRDAYQRLFHGMQTRD